MQETQRENCASPAEDHQRGWGAGAHDAGIELVEAPSLEEFEIHVDTAMGWTCSGQQAGLDDFWKSFPT